MSMNSYFGLLGAFDEYRQAHVMAGMMGREWYRYFEQIYYGGKVKFRASTSWYCKAIFIVLIMMLPLRYIELGGIRCFRNRGLGEKRITSWAST